MFKIHFPFFTEVSAKLLAPNPFQMHTQVPLSSSVSFYFLIFCFFVPKHLSTNQVSVFITNSLNPILQGQPIVKLVFTNIFSGYNTTRAKFENDDKDFNVSRIVDEVNQIIYYPSVNKSGSILFMNFGLHFSESTTFSNYKSLITELLKLLKRKDFYKGKIIWRTTTSLNQHKLGGKHQHSRRFLTHQVSILNII